ncbi:hypothetical protein Ct9H90mP29_06830 [bacterium]|nr:MAG: hypothetical protein Ct9H90mP29_06830 [bacterium]
MIWILLQIFQRFCLTATLFFKTNFMAYYQEFSLKGTQGLYQFTYEPKTYPGTHLQYYFVIETR